MTMFQRIPNERLSDRVFRQLVEMIHAGELPIGSKLPTETVMAQQLGVSRGILREALNILQAKGYITRLPREGTLVCQLSDSDIGGSITNQVKNAKYDDLLEFREAMERKAVQKVVELATDAEIDELYELVEKTGDTPSAYSSRDYYFHYRLAQYSRNALFVVFLDMFFDTINEIARTSYQDKDRQHEVKLEHLRILDAIRRRDKQAATEAIEHHLQRVRKQVDSDTVKASAEGIAQ